MNASAVNGGLLRLGTLVCLVVLSGCATQRVASDPATDVGPQLSVERFLQATNARDFDAMGNLFGTADGALMDTGSTFGCMFKKMGSWFGGNACRTRESVELQMDAIASVLRHTDYRITQQRLVAGRRHPTTRVMVNLTMPDGRTVTDVPFDVVQSPNGRWFVQEVALARVMQGDR